LDDEIVDNTNNEEWNENVQSPGEKSSGLLSGNSDKYYTNNAQSILEIRGQLKKKNSQKSNQKS